MKQEIPPSTWVAIGLVLLVSLAIDLYTTAQGGSIDLRNRVTGTRLLVHGIDPYHYKWHYGEPAEYCDVYNNPNVAVSKTTATPALLTLTVPLAALPYSLGQIAWLLVQWALLLGTGALWIRLCNARWQRLLIALAIIGFTFTAAWRLHAERGQAYVLLAFLLSAWMALTLETRWNFVAGLLGGFLAALRPTFLLAAPFLALHRRGQLLGMACGLVLGIGAPLVIQPHDWSNYYTAMQENSNLYRNSVEPAPGRNHYYAETEGIRTDELAKFAVIPYADFSVFALIKAMGLDRNPATGAAIPAWPVLVAFLLLLGGWLWFSRTLPVAKLLPGVAAWFFLADLFLPAYRDSYNDVLVLSIIGGAVFVATRIPWHSYIFAAGMLVGFCIFYFVPEDKWLINLPTACFTLVAVLAIYQPLLIKRREAPSVE